MEIWFCVAWADILRTSRLDISDEGVEEEFILVTVASYVNNWPVPT